MTPLPDGASTDASFAPLSFVSMVDPGDSSTSCSIFLGETWNRRIFLRSLGGPPSSASIEGPPALARASNAALFGAKTVPENCGPSSPARPALSTSCFRSEYCEFLERAAGLEEVFGLMEEGRKDGWRDEKGRRVEGMGERVLVCFDGGREK